MPPAEATTTTTETLVGFVEQHAQRRPDGIAIHYGDRPRSWAQWALRIRRRRYRRILPPASGQL